MSSKYQEDERKRQAALITESDLFEGAKVWGLYREKKRAFMLLDGDDNLYPAIKDDAKKYFTENKVSWWVEGKQPTGHLLSSQIACVNHLFAIRKDKDTVLSLLNHIAENKFAEGDRFTEVLPISSDKDKGFIAFEAISGYDHLNERSSIRGSDRTSIDALIYAKHTNGEKWIIPIEWMYTEHYSNEDKAKGSNGEIRRSRYNQLIKNSEQLKQSYTGLFYYEPFYQLMRQTLWAEQMVLSNNTESVKADNFIHLHVIPTANDKLLKKIYKPSSKDMEASWRDAISNQDKYKIIDNKFIIDYISTLPSYAKLGDYLSKRYL